jgi:eukaryotic-like serine/threonine-protein kinase
MGHVAQRNETRGASNLAGKYRLIAELGQGGMATVYLAVAMGQSGFRKLAVVKLLRPEIAVDAEFVQMFLDEAKLCARLSHPNIVHTYDVGVDEVGHLMAMEYLDGVSLHAAVAKLARNGGPFKFALQARVLLDVVEGLRYAHELKDYDGRSLEIVHRDVTPHNIFVTYDGQVKLLDFGIAKAATSSVRTATGVIKGKLTYMAPEQARGEPVDARADLYAVGVMLWEAVTGRRRWPTGLSQPALFTRLASGEPPENPNATSFGYPPEVDTIILKALAPKPDDRYQTAAEMRVALEGVLAKLEPVSLRDLGVMLGNAFSDGRTRLREVIEEQFRVIDRGGRPSEPHQLPAVTPPGFMTASDVLERHGQPAETAKIDSQSVRMTGAIESGVSPPSRLRARVAIGVAALAIAGTALAVAIAGSHTRSWSSDEPAQASGLPHAAGSPGDVGTAAGSPANPVQADTGRTHVESPSSSEGLPPVESVRRVEGRSRPAPPVSRGPGPRVSSTTTQSPSDSAAPTSPAASVSPPNDSILLRREGRPKVQLERDNPWP